MTLKKLTVPVGILLAFSSAQAGVMRYDLSIQDYRDFGENRGRFKAGSTGVPVYRSDGTLDATLDFPLPDFSMVYDLGRATLHAPSYLVGVRHSNSYWNAIWGNKAKYAYNYSLIARNADPNADFNLPRLNKVVTDATPVESVSKEEFINNRSRYTWLTRVGAGQQIQINSTQTGAATVAGPHQWKIAGTIADKNLILNTMLRWNFSATTPFSTGGAPGDSGSPVFVYDSLEKKWKIVGVMTAVSYEPINRRTHAAFIQTDFINSVLAANTDPDVEDLASDGAIHWTASTLQQGDRQWDWHGLDARYASEAPIKASKDELNATKDLRFNGEGGEIILDQAVNMGAAKLQFSNNYTVRGTEDNMATWVGGGIETDKESTVLWQVNGLKGDALHKIGQGTLHVNAVGNNPGELNVGDGTVFLDQQADAMGNKQAFSKITLVSGRPTVVLNDADQVSSSDIYFGFNGGTLDVNGNSLSFDQIKHNDNGARIVNHHASQQALLTLTGDNQRFVGQLGDESSQHKLDLLYKPEQATSQFLLAGGGWLNDLTVAKGQLQLGGEQVLHAGNVLFSDDWDTRSYHADRVNIEQGTSLKLGEHATLTAATRVLTDATLALHGRTTLDGSVDLVDTTSRLLADISPEESTAGELASVINADVSGAGELSKQGEGHLTLNGNITTLRDVVLSEGELEVNGQVTPTLTMGEHTRLSGTGNIQQVMMADNATLAPGSSLRHSNDAATLRIGTLSAGKNTHLLLNSAFTATQTDRLLIAGDLQTPDNSPVMLTVIPKGEWSGSDTNGNGVADSREGISVIQVGGQARANSIKLAGEYVARGAWAYGLYTFAPGKSSAEERLVEGDGDRYWDYRLQNIMLSEGDNAIPVAPEPLPEHEPEHEPEPVPGDEPAPEPLPQPIPDTEQDLSPAPSPAAPARRAVTPQVPGYISLPAALKNIEQKRSALFRESAQEAVTDSRANFFLFGYNGEDRYHSANSFINYGYDFKSQYNGWMMGGQLLAAAGDRQALTFSAALSDGTLAVTPEAKDGVSKGNYKNWGVDALLTWRHLNGLQLDVPFGYTRTTGTISTDLRGGNVARIHSQNYYAGIEVSQRLERGNHQWQPLLGLDYAQRNTRSFTDADGAKVEYRNGHRPDYSAGVKYRYRNSAYAYPFSLGTEIRYVKRAAQQGEVLISADREQARFATGNGGDNLQLKAQGTVNLHENVALSLQLQHQQRVQKEGVNDLAAMGGVKISF